MSNPYFNATGNPQSQARGLSSQIRNEFAAIQNGFQLVQDAHLSSALPGQTGNAGKLIKTDGTTASWSSITGYSARTSNTILGLADFGKLIDITSGTFSQTFSAAATLNDNWFCYIRNAGTGDITLDPNGTELIDGLSSYVMYPGETRFVICDGDSLKTIVLTSFKRTYTASDTFAKPPGYNRIAGLLWGGGGGSNGTYGGNGGCCVPFDLDSSAIAATQAVTIGAGGAAGADGGNSVFATVSSGSAGKGNTSGTTAFGLNPTPGPVPPIRFATGNTTGPYNADYGGGHGSAAAGALGGYEHSIYGGAGGVASGAAGTSVFGGAGGVGAGNGTAPGGGGGSTGAGARGELRLWGIL